MSCINMRGAIWHGRRPSMWFSMKQMFEFGKRRVGEGGHVETIFENNFFGVRAFSGGLHSKLVELKTEIMTHGPVVSSGFRTSHSFLGRDDKAFDPNTKNGEISSLQSMVILGWELSDVGEVWIVRKSWGSGSHQIKISFGQFGVDENVIAPKKSMSVYLWQEGLPWKCSFPKILTNTQGEHWEDWRRITRETTAQELHQLCKLLDISDMADLIGKTVVRHAIDRPARSYSYRITAVKVVAECFEVILDREAPA